MADPPGAVAARALAAFVAGVRLEDLDDVLRERARKAILDCLGCGLYGSRSESADHFLRYVRAQGGRAQARVWGHRGRVPARDAALVNGTFVHATELSETFTRAVVHPGNVIVPALIAVGERDHRPGRALIAATVVAYEVLVRLGLSLGPRMLLEQGLHVPSVAGTLGAAVATANLLGLDETTVGHALGIAACLTPTCLMAAAGQNATVKDLFEGSAASLGVVATDLALAGVTGVDAWIEPWYRALSQRADPRALTDGLGSFWHINSGGLHFKERALMAMAQPTVDAVVDLTARVPMDHRAVSAIVVETTRRSQLGTLRHPRTILSAKGSLPFLTAAALVRQAELAGDPHCVRFLRPELLDDPDIWRLAELVDVRVDPEMDDHFERAWPMQFEARVRVRLASGEEHTGYADIWPRSSTLSYADVADKFRRVTEGVVGADRAERIVETVAALESVRDCATLAALLAPAP